MHPAYSIIFFTTASGMGYGLAAVLGLGMLDASEISTKFAHFVALALISSGLMTSTMHLGNPQRAWRAFSQWRSSWLSREGVLAVTAFIPLCASAWLSIFEGRHVMSIGLTGALLSVLTVYCTSMIYASLKSIHAWHTPITSIAYLTFAAAGGLSLACVFASWSGDLSPALAVSTVIALIIAWIVKIIWRNRMLNEPQISTPESATGLGSIGKVSLLERPHVTGNYLTREMGFRVARKHGSKLAALSLVSGCLLPVILIVIALLAPLSPMAVVVLMVLTLALHALGVVTERWLFFAEARHAVMNYYGG